MYSFFLLFIANCFRYVFKIIFKIGNHLQLHVYSCKNCSDNYCIIFVILHTQVGENYRTDDLIFACKLNVWFFFYMSNVQIL